MKTSILFTVSIITVESVSLSSCQFKQKEVELTSTIDSTLQV